MNLPDAASWGPWIALLALLVSGATLWRTESRWRRDAALVRVTWKLGYLADGMLQDGPMPGTATWRRFEQRAPEFSTPPIPNLEVVVIDVENAGRTGVTISSPSIAFHPWLRRPPRRLERLSFVPVRRSSAAPLVEWQDATTTRRTRLEPFDRTTFIMRSEALLSGNREHRPCWARAAVTVAGRSSEQLAPRAQAVRLEEGQMSLSPQAPDLPLMVYRRLYAHHPLGANIGWSVARESLQKDPDVSWPALSEAIARAIPGRPRTNLYQLDLDLERDGIITRSEVDKASKRRQQAWDELDANRTR